LSNFDVSIEENCQWSDFYIVEKESESHIHYNVYCKWL